MSGRFVVFEGGEGSGKSTQAAMLAEHLGALLTREPGGTELGARLRELLLAAPGSEAGGSAMTKRTEALLMAADRAQHAAEVLAPTLATGRDVVCDRYIPSDCRCGGGGAGKSGAQKR